jgi:hypothetical protein
MCCIEAIYKITFFPASFQFQVVVIGDPRIINPLNVLQHLLRKPVRKQIMCMEYCHFNVNGLRPLVQAHHDYPI